MKNLKLYSGIKKVLLGTMIIVTLATATGCLSSEERTISNAKIVIDDKEYTVRDLYFLRTKDKSEYICYKMDIGTTLSGENYDSVYAI